MKITINEVTLTYDQAACFSMAVGELLRGLKKAKELKTDNDSYFIDVVVERMLEAVTTISHLLESEPPPEPPIDEEVPPGATYTDEQVNDICYKIGEWYLDWKHRICAHKMNCPGCECQTHWLGQAKENLKYSLFTPSARELKNLILKQEQES